MNCPGQAALEVLLKRQDLDEAQAFQLMIDLTAEDMTPAMAGALLVSLNIKGETADEIRGMAAAMRSLSRRPQIAEGEPIADIVGTGGDGSHSLNLSTGAALLAAAAGLRIVKHGNRSVSSRSGSADVLEALGLPLPLDEAAAGQCLARTGFTFLFAPHYHPAMKSIAPVRKALGVRTVFNLLGPLTHPAKAPYAVIGAWSVDVAQRMAEALCGLPIKRMFVLHGEGGWDEPTPASPFTLFDVSPAGVSRGQHSVDDFGLPACKEAELKGEDASHNAARLAGVLRGQEHGAHRNALLMGAALALQVTGRCADLREGVAQAAAAIDDGRASQLLDELARFGAGIRR